MCAISESRLCKKEYEKWRMHYGLRAMLAMTLRQKKGELESKSSNKSETFGLKERNVMRCPTIVCRHSPITFISAKNSQKKYL